MKSVCHLTYDNENFSNAIEIKQQYAYVNTYPAMRKGSWKNLTENIEKE